jgi:hypothetical protein
MRQVSRRRSQQKQGINAKEKIVRGDSFQITAKQWRTVA